jgi:hypothetical protein
MVYLSAYCLGECCILALDIREQLQRMLQLSKLKYKWIMQKSRTIGSIAVYSNSSELLFSLSMPWEPPQWSLEGNWCLLCTSIEHVMKLPTPRCDVMEGRRDRLRTLSTTTEKSCFEFSIVSYMKTEGFWRWWVVICKIVFLDFVHRLHKSKITTFRKLSYRRIGCPSIHLWVISRRWLSVVFTPGISML